MAQNVKYDDDDRGRLRQFAVVFIGVMKAPLVNQRATSNSASVGKIVFETVTSIDSQLESRMFTMSMITGYSI